jgi:Fe-S-cluster-containing dehydrogenase component
MSKWNLIVDVGECTNCQDCTLATMDEYVGNEWPGYAAPMPRLGHRWIDIKAKERGQVPTVDVAFMPTMCNHCDNAPCMKVAKDGAITKRADGIVIIDPVKAKGQKEIVDACPYGAVWWNDELQLPQHWNFDAHLLDRGWTKTRGELSCPIGAMKAVKVSDDEMQRMAKAEELEVLQPELGTKPRVYYRNIYRYTKAFIAGTVSTLKNGEVDCLEGAKVRLIKDGKTIAQMQTDNYGDFKFDRLDEKSGAYRVEIEAPGLPAKALDVTLNESVVLGEVRL